MEAEDAMEAAHAVDRRLDDGATPGKLTGVPLAHKDMFYRKGKVTTCGSKIRKDFVANASHELRTPLAIIDGYLENLIEDDLLENKETSLSGTSLLWTHWDHPAPSLWSIKFINNLSVQ